MKILDLSFPTPEENLACDEALLEACEEGRIGETLRFWESQRYFVVLGYSNRANSEANLEACRREGVPVLRRLSGGGTVLQGPGCLNYTLFLKINERPECRTIQSANAFVMKRHRDAFKKLLKADVEVAGHTDLVLGSLKFSGNSQRRKRNYLLFHGTFLLNFDWAMIEKTLTMPSQEPPYRKKRPHREFLTNLSLPATAVKKALIHSWAAGDPLDAIPHNQIRRLVDDVYSKEDWNFKF